MFHLFNKKDKINKQSSPDKAYRRNSNREGIKDSGNITYPPIYPKSFSLSEPWTVQKDRLERGCKDYGSERALRLYNSHRVKLENQWINPLQGINSGLGTANLSLYNYQTVDFVECRLSGSGSSYE